MLNEGFFGLTYPPPPHNHPTPPPPNTLELIPDWVDTSLPFTKSTVKQKKKNITDNPIILHSWQLLFQSIKIENSIGGFHANSGDTNNNGEMNKCWWTNKAS